MVPQKRNLHYRFGSQQENQTAESLHHSLSRSPSAKGLINSKAGLASQIVAPDIQVDGSKIDLSAF